MEDVKPSFTNDIVGFEEVSVKSLYRQVISGFQFLWINKVKQHSIVERSLAILASEMSISFFNTIFLIEESFDIDVTATIIIHGFDINSVEYTYSHFKLLWRLRSNIEYISGCVVLI